MGKNKKIGVSAENGLVKTPKLPKLSKIVDKVTANKYKRVAQFLVLAGSEKASEILAFLDPAQVEAISGEIVHIKTISVEEGEAVLEEFRSLLSRPFSYSGSSSGGIEEARRLLYAAFGPEKGEEFLKRAVPGAVLNPFDFLQDFSPRQIALFFKDESPAACAMVFSRLPSEIAASVLANIETARKTEIVKRIARLGEISPDVMARTAAALREKARHFGRADDGAGSIDGMGALAAILKSSDISFGGRIMEELAGSDPELGRGLKDRLYTLDGLVSASGRPIQEKLRSMSDRDIALLLKGRPVEFTDKIYDNLSSGRAARVREESGIMGPVPKIEIEAVQREFLGWFRLAREEGKIFLKEDEDIVL